MENCKNDASDLIVVPAFKSNIRQYTMFIALLLIWGIFTFLTEFIFLTPRNLTNLFVQSATTAILAIGMTLVIVTGHIDLSVGSVLGFTGAVGAVIMVKTDLGIWPAMACTLIAGALIGAWHGFWVAYRRVPAFIVTLASMLAFRGAIIGITGGQTLGLEMARGSTDLFKAIGQAYLPKINSTLPFNDTSLYFTLFCILLFIIFDMRKRKSRIKFGFKVLPIGLQILKLSALSVVIGAAASIMIFYMGIPYSILLVLAMTLIFSFIASNTVFGRHLYAIGGNPEAARLSGINIKKQTMKLFIIMGVVTAIAGLVFTARTNAATTSAGVNAELDAIAAVVIGGTSLMGGEGIIIGSVIGALVMESLNNGMSLMNLDVTWQYMIKGLILLLAVWADIATRKKAT